MRIIQNEGKRQSTGCLQQRLAEYQSQFTLAAVVPITNEKPPAKTKKSLEACLQTVTPLHFQIALGEAVVNLTGANASRHAEHSFIKESNNVTAVAFFRLTASNHLVIGTKNGRVILLREDKANHSPNNRQMGKWIFETQYLVTESNGPKGPVTLSTSSLNENLSKITSSVKAFILVGLNEGGLLLLGVSKTGHQQNLIHLLSIAAPVDATGVSAAQLVAMSSSSSLMAIAGWKQTNDVFQIKFFVGRELKVSSHQRRLWHGDKLGSLHNIDIIALKSSQKSEGQNLIEATQVGLLSCEKGVVVLQLSPELIIIYKQEISPTKQLPTLRLIDSFSDGASPSNFQIIALLSTPSLEMLMIELVNGSWSTSSKALQFHQNSPFQEQFSQPHDAIISLCHSGTGLYVTLKRGSQNSFRYLLHLHDRNSLIFSFLGQHKLFESRLLGVIETDTRHLMLVGSGGQVCEIEWISGKQLVQNWITQWKNNNNFSTSPDLIDLLLILQERSAGSTNQQGKLQLGIAVAKLTLTTSLSSLSALDLINAIERVDSRSFMSLSQEEMSPLLAKKSRDSDQGFTKLSLNDEAFDLLEFHSLIMKCLELLLKFNLLATLEEFCASCIIQEQQQSLASQIPDIVDTTINALKDDSYLHPTSSSTLFRSFVSFKETICDAIVHYTQPDNSFKNFQSNSSFRLIVSILKFDLNFFIKNFTYLIEIYHDIVFDIVEYFFWLSDPSSLHKMKSKNPAPDLQRREQFGIVSAVVVQHVEKLSQIHPVRTTKILCHIACREPNGSPPPERIMASLLDTLRAVHANEAEIQLLRVIMQNPKLSLPEANLRILDLFLKRHIYVKHSTPVSQQSPSSDKQIFFLNELRNRRSGEEELIKFLSSVSIDETCIKQIDSYLCEYPDLIIQIPTRSGEFLPLKISQRLCFPACTLFISRALGKVMEGVDCLKTDVVMMIGEVLGVSEREEITDSEIIVSLCREIGEIVLMAIKAHMAEDKRVPKSLRSKLWNDILSETYEFSTKYPIAETTTRVWSSMASLIIDVTQISPESTVRLLLGFLGQQTSHTDPHWVEILKRLLINSMSQVTLYGSIGYDVGTSIKLTSTKTVEKLSKLVSHGVARGKSFDETQVDNMLGSMEKLQNGFDNKDNLNKLLNKRLTSSERGVPTNVGGIFESLDYSGKKQFAPYKDENVIAAGLG